MPNLHPLMVHFPIALLTVSVALDFVSVLREKEELARSGWWTMLIGVCWLAASVISGLFAKESVVLVGKTQEVFEVHQQLAFLVAVMFGTLILWRLGTQTTLPARLQSLYLGLSLLALVLMWVGALYGGRMVYEFGVGVSLQQDADRKGSVR